MRRIVSHASIAVIYSRYLHKGLELKIEDHGVEGPAVGFVGLKPLTPWHLIRYTTVRNSIFQYILPCSLVLNILQHLVIWGGYVVLISLNKHWSARVTLNGLDLPILRLVTLPKSLYSFILIPCYILFDQSSSMDSLIIVTNG